MKAPHHRRAACQALGHRPTHTTKRARRIYRRRYKKAVRMSQNRRRVLLREFDEKKPSLLLNLPIELKLRVLDHLEPFEWSVLEGVCTQTRALVVQKCRDVVDLDLCQDYVRPLSQKHYKRRLLHLKLDVLTDFLKIRFTSLESLTLSDCSLNLQGSSGSHTLRSIGAALPKLKELHMLNKATGDGLTRRKGVALNHRALQALNEGFENLRVLNIDGCICLTEKNEPPCQFVFTPRSFPHIQKISVRNCTASIGFSDEFLNKSHLTGLDFENFDAYGESPFSPILKIALGLCSQSVTEVNISKIPFFDHIGQMLLNQVFKLPNLKYCEMGGPVNMPRVNAPAPFALQNWEVVCSQLEALLVPNSIFLCANLLQTVVEKCPGLGNFSLSSPPISLRSDHMKFLAHCQNLFDLNLSDSDVTDDTIDHLIRKLPQLSALNIRGCKQLTNQALFSLGLHGKNLEILYLRRKSRKIDEKGLQAVLDGCPKLAGLEATAKMAEKLKVGGPMSKLIILDNLLS